MATERQIAAARANGARSRGPKTPEGKRKSSANSRKHGLYAQSGPVDDRYVELYNQFLQSHQTCLQPETPMETALVQTLAEASANKWLAIEMQETMLADEIRNQAAKHPVEDQAGDSRHRYALLASRAMNALIDKSSAFLLLVRLQDRYARHYFLAFDRLLEMRKRTAGFDTAPFNNAVALFEEEAAIAENEPDFRPSAATPAPPTPPARAHHRDNLFFTKRTGFQPRSTPSRRPPVPPPRHSYNRSIHSNKGPL